MAASWRTVRVFLSSTFRDMHAERDHLVKVAFPALRERLEPYRVYLVDVDLRWGVTREQAENDRVLDLCLRQIEECRPFFVGILGQRYGWVPSRFPANALEKYAWVRGHGGRSVTELEILHGVLNNPRMRGHAFFYFRDPAALDAVPESTRSAVYAETDPERVRQLEDLKARIRSGDFPVMGNYPARWDPEAYDPPTRSRGRLVGLEAFGERVLEQLWEAVRNELNLAARPPAQVAPDPLADEADYHERFVESRLRVYVGREEVNRALLSFAGSDDTVPCLVIGPPGSGKSAALARFVTEYRRQHPEALVVPHFAGASPRSTSLRELLRRCCSILKGRFGFEEKIAEATVRLADTFRRFLARIPPSDRVLFVLDALDQLDEVDQAGHLEWLPTSLRPHVKVVVSCVSAAGGDAPALPALRRRAYRPLTVAPLRDEERRAIVGLVPSLSAKTLDEHQVDLLLDNPATTNPLYLLVALEELRGFGSYEALNERIQGLPRGEDTLPALFTQVIERLEHDFDRTLVRNVLGSLAAARRGLSEQELSVVAASGAGSGELFAVLRHLRLYLLRRGELVGYYHSSMAAAVRSRYLGTPEASRAGHLFLANFFERQNLRRPTARAVDELPWQLCQAEAWERLHDLLAYLPFFGAAWEADPFSVKACWVRVEENTPYRLVDAYRPVLEQTHNYGKYAWEVACLLMDTGHPAEALSLRASITEKDRQGFTERLPRSLVNQALILYQQGDLDGALALFQQAEQFCRERGDDHILATSLVNQAMILEDRGLLDKAFELYRAQEQVFCRLEDLDGIQACLGNQARVLAGLGQLDRALDIFKQQVRHSRQGGNLSMLQASLGNQALILRRRGNLEEAQALHGEEEQICRQIGDWEGLQGSLGNQGLIAEQQGDLSRALKLFEEAGRISRQFGIKLNLAICLGNQARVLGSLGEPSRALDLLAEQERLNLEMGNKGGLITTYLGQANVLMRLDGLEGAVGKLRRRDELSAELASTGRLAAAQQLREYGIVLPVDPEG